MTQKQFIKQLMGRGVSHSDACGLVAYMKITCPPQSWRYVEDDE